MCCFVIFAFVMLERSEQNDGMHFMIKADSL